MKKQKYYIFMKEKLEENHVKSYLEEVNGYVDEEKGIGYHKEGDLWISTMLSCGLSIFKTKTRKENIEKIENNWDDILKRMEHPYVIKMTKKFESLKAGDQK